MVLHLIIQPESEQNKSPSDRAPQSLSQLHTIPDPIVKTELEELDSCDADRKYLEKPLNQVPYLYRAERTKNENEFPAECLISIMRQFKPEAEKHLSNEFLVCNLEDGLKKSHGYKPCVSANYVQAIYNYFGDLTDCSGASQRDLIPFIGMSSGFHLNYVDGQEYFGLGQLSEKEINILNENFDELKEQIQSSNRSSCRRLSPDISLMNKINIEGRWRCEVTTAPRSPLTSLFYFILKYKKTDEFVRNLLQDQNGLIIKKYNFFKSNSQSLDQDQLRQLLIHLAYIVGPAQAQKVFEQYLQLQFEKKHLIQPKDFDLSYDRPYPPNSFADFLNHSGNENAHSKLKKLFDFSKILNAQFPNGLCISEAFLNFQ